MEDFIERMISEYKVESIKLDKLNDFINTDKFQGLDTQYKYHTKMQALLMEQFLEHLKARIKCLGYDI